MAELTQLIERVRALPDDQQNQIVELVEEALAQLDGAGSLFSDEDWAAIRPTLDEDGEEIPHEQVVAELRAKHGFAE